MKKSLLVVSIVFIMFFGIKVNAASVKELKLDKVEAVGLTSKIDTYNSAQSIVVTDKYLVVMLTDTNDNNKNALYVYKNNNGSFTYHKIIRNRHYGHGNDMTYNPKTNEIAIINSNEIIILNANNFKEKRKVSVYASRSNIAYDENKDNYYLGSSSVGLYKYNANFKNLGNVVSNNNYRGNQGISVYGKNIYVCNYIFDGTLSNYSSYGNFNLKESLIFRYNKSGKLGKIYHIASKYKELESIAFWNNTPYLLFQRGGTFNIYTSTNMVSNTTDEVSGEISNIDSSIMTNENQINLQQFIEQSTEINNDTSQNTNINPEPTSPSTDTSEINNNVTPPEIETNPSVDNSNTSSTTQIIEPPVIENQENNNGNVVETPSDTSVSTSTEENINTNNTDNQINVYNSDNDEDIEEFVVEVPDTKKNNNIYLSIIGILTIIFGIVLERNLTKKINYVKITTK